MSKTHLWEASIGNTTPGIFFAPVILSLRMFRELIIFDNNKTENFMPKGFLLKAILLFLITTGILFILPVKAQEVVFKRFTMRDGLPASEIYDVYQDGRGFLWFASDKGLCRYDGHSFKTFTTQDGLSENVIFTIHEDKKGTLWFSTFSKGLCCYNGNRFFVPSFNEDLMKILGGNNWVKNLLFDNSNLPWFSIRNNTDHNKIYTLNDHGQLVDKTIPNPGGSAGLLCDIEGTLLENNNYPIENREGLGVKKQAGIFYVFTAGRDIKNAVRLADHSFFCASDQNVFHFSDSGILKVYPFGVTCNKLYTADQKSVWASTARGAYLISPGKDDSVTKYFESSFITDILKDNEGNFWFTTLDAGVFMVPSFNFKRLAYNNSSDDRINTLGKTGHGLYFTTYSGALYRIDSAMQRHNVIYGKNIYINSQYAAGKDTILLANGYFLNERNMKAEKWGNGAVKCMARLSNGMLVLGFIDGFEIYEGNKKVFRSLNVRFSKRITALCSGPDNILFIGTLSGLYSFDFNNKKLVKKSILNKRISTLAFEDNKLTAGTTEDGIYILENDRIKVHYNKADGLAGNFIHDFCYLHQDTLWVATHKGLTRIVMKETGPSFLNLTLHDGLPANEIYALKSFQGYLWAATERGLSYFDPAALDVKRYNHPVYLTGIRVNEKDTLPDTSFRFLPYQRNISFAFAGISYRHADKLQYFYRLDGIHKDWNRTVEPFVEFAGLLPGSYRLRIAASIGTDLSFLGPETTVSFEIARHFTETWWFRTLIIAAFILFLSGTVYIYIRNQKNRIRNKEQLIFAEQKALRAQMNPHFIFNAMNSIQYYISENNKAEAGIFLSKFSSLMRSILENSGQSMIPLEEDLDCIRQYLELERQRFSNRFRYDIVIDPNISLYDTYIPSMMIQPFLENAIWHGLIPKEETEGYVLLCILKKDDMINCTIQDNGIGRKKAALLNNRSRHKSSALKNIGERIRLINKIHKINLRLEIEDLETDGETGTRTTLTYKILI